MPRGVPKNGFRLTKKRMGRGWVPPVQVSDLPNVVPFMTPAAISGRVNPAPTKVETDEEILARISGRFEILHRLAVGAVSGDIRALIVSGPAGLGKSFTVEKVLESGVAESNYTIVKGYIRATNLFKTLFDYRDPGQVIVFDDADTIFTDETSLNLLKAVCDTTEKRTVSYLTEGNLISDKTSERVPKSFEFNGTIIFITNHDFDAMIERQHKLAPHLSAMMSRAHYVDLSMKTDRDSFVRIKQVINLGMLNSVGLSVSEQKQVVDFIEDNLENMRELSLRIAIKIAALIRADRTDWLETAKVTCCKNT